MNPTLRQMRALVAVARTGNFTLAAHYLHITQSALSGLIKELEATVAVRLIDRSTRRLSLSDMGRELYPLFSQIIDDLDSALTNIADHTQLKKGLVRVAAPQLMSCTMLPAVIASYRQLHPEIQLRLIDSPVDEVASRLLNGDVDLGIGPERDTVGQFEAKQLFQMPFRAVMPVGHPLTARTELGWEELAQSPLILLQGQFTERLLADLHAAGSPVTLHAANEVTFMTTALALVQSGIGLTVCLPYAEPLASRHGLVMRPLADPVLTRRFFVYTSSQRSLSPAAESFAAFLLEFAASL